MKALNAARAWEPTKMDRDLPLLVSAQFINSLGTSLFSMTVVLFIQETFHSTHSVGMALLTTALPAALLGPFAGVLIDRWNKKWVPVSCDALGAATCAGMLVASRYFVEDPVTLSKILLLGAFVLGLLHTLLLPAVFSLAFVKSKTVGAERASAWLQASFRLAAIAGMACAPLLRMKLALSTLILLNGVSFLVSSFLQAGIQPLPESEKDLNVHPTSAWSDLRGSLACFHLTPGLAGMLALATVLNFVIAPVLVFLPSFVTDHLHLGSEFYGLAMAAQSLGMILGPLLWARSLSATKNPVLLSLKLFFGLAVALFLVGLSQGQISLLAYNLGLGLILGVLNVWLISQVQTRVHPGHLGRVTSLFMNTSAMAMPLGFAVAGVYCEMLGNNPHRIFGVVAALLALIVCAAQASGVFRRFFKIA